MRGKDDADEALEITYNIFNNNISDNRLPNISKNKINLQNDTFSILDAIEELSLVKSRGEIKRLIKSDGVKINDKIYKNNNYSLKEFSDFDEIKITIERKLEY